MSAPSSQPNPLTPTSTPVMPIDPATQMGLVSVTVADLERSLAYYQEALGFALLDRDATHATLGAGEAPLLLLSAEPGARPWPHERRSYTGLYHFAILLPTRADLGRWLRHWLESGFPPPGQSDHLVSEALYLRDPDGHGIEIYRDRPRSEWHWNGDQVQMAIDPIDMRSLLAEGREAPWTGMPAGTRLGHMHLQVGDIPQAEAFYHGVLGFDVTQGSLPSALFISAGGYHHHIGMNTWHSQGAGPAPAGTAGLQFYTIEFPSVAARDAVLTRVRAANGTISETGRVVAIQDPWANTIVMTIGAATVPTAPELRAVAESAR